MQGQTEGDIPQEDRQEQNLRFQGQYLDRETGLHYNTFRYYDADIGRFISPDPIGLEGGVNFGRYAPNPINWIDPWGLEVVYRGMSQTEYAGLKKNGQWSSHGTMEGKWFATSYKDAVTWGQKMGHGGDFVVVQIDIPAGMDVHRNSQLDGIGSAVYIENSELNKFKTSPRWSKNVKC